VGEVRVLGMEEIERNLRRAAITITRDGVERGLEEATKVLRKAVMAAAPRRIVAVNKREYGPIRTNVFRKRVEVPGSLTAAITQLTWRVGISAKAFYGYFIERGWRPAGRAVMRKINAPRLKNQGYMELTRRNLRISGAQAGHSQQGGEGHAQIAGRPFLGPTFDSLKDELERIIAERTAAAVERSGR